MDASMELLVALCPFCGDSFPAHVVTDHCNHCVDAVGLCADTPVRGRRAQPDVANASQDTSRARTPVPPSSSVASTLRGMVSQNKRRYQRDGFDLDLTYITPRIIAMGFPSHGTEGYYRNPVEEVERFFETYHKRKFRLYNLCSERDYDDNLRFGGSYRRYPFDDHNVPVPLSLIPDFCDDALDYLKEDPQNVIAVHCKAGKGRTGVMVAALLMSMDSALRKAEDALRMFADIRTCDGKGVTIPSQVRYVRYWDSMLSQSLRLRPDSRVLKMERMTVFGNVKPEPYFLVLDGETREELFDSRRKGFTKLEFRRDTWVWEVLQAGKEVPLRGDLKFVFKAKERVLFRTEGHLFHFWINSAFAPDCMFFEKSQLDKACKDSKHDTFRSDLAVEVAFACGDKPSVQQRPRGVW